MIVNFRIHKINQNTHKINTQINNNKKGVKADKLKSTHMLTAK